MFSFSTGLVSQIFTVPSSDTDIKNTILPSIGFFLSTLTPTGINYISATKFLCELIMLDMANGFNFTIDY
jgi:hypothetical protein